MPSFGSKPLSFRLRSGTSNTSHKLTVLPSLVTGLTVELKKVIEGCHYYKSRMARSFADIFTPILQVNRGG